MPCISCTAKVHRPPVLLPVVNSLFLFSFIAIGLFSDLTVSAQNTTSKPSTVISEEDSSVYSGDVIVWKYKTMNGKLYKRKYNQTTKKWIGKWIQA